MISLSVTDRSITNFKQLTWGFLVVGALVLVSDITFRICFQIELTVGEPRAVLLPLYRRLKNKQTDPVPCLGHERFERNIR